MADESEKKRDFEFALKMTSITIDCLDRPEQERLIRALQDKYEQTDAQSEF